MDNMLTTYIIISVLIVSLISILAILPLFFYKGNLDNIIIVLVSLSAGTLLGGAFLHLLPEILSEHGADNLNIWLSLLFGLVFFFFLEKIVCWRHCHVETSEDHPHPLGIMNLIGDGFHNLLDGIAIAAAFMLSIPSGIMVTIAVISHEIPQEIADFGVLLHAGFSKTKALLLNFLTALSAFFGALIAILLNTKIENFLELIIPFTAGGFIYIATADLIPELKKDNKINKSLLQLFTIILGILIMLGIKIFFEE